MGIPFTGGFMSGAMIGGAVAQTAPTAVREIPATQMDVEFDLRIPNRVAIAADGSRANKEARCAACLPPPSRERLAKLYKAGIRRFGAGWARFRVDACYYFATSNTPLRNMEKRRPLREEGRTGVALVWV